MLLLCFAKRINKIKDFMMSSLKTYSQIVSKEFDRIQYTTETVMSLYTFKKTDKETKMYDILANEKNSLENEFGLNNIIRPPSCYPDVNSQQTAGNWAEANLESKISVRSQVDATNFITETKANIADLQRTVQELRSKLDEKEQQQNESVKELKRVKLSNHISDIIRVFYNKFVYKFKLNDYVENDDGEIIANDKFYKRLQRETNLAENELGLKPNQQPIIDDN